MKSRCGLAGLQGILTERALAFMIMQPQHIWEPQAVQALLSRPSCLCMQPAGQDLDSQPAIFGPSSRAF